MSTTSQYSGNWNYPTRVIFGAGQREKLPAICSELMINNPLLVTDQGLAKLPLLTDIKTIFEKNNQKFSVFSDIKPNPTGENVTAGVNSFKNSDHDGVIALGGGSALDAAKAIALMIGQSRDLWDFEDIGNNWTRVNTDNLMPVIAVPTTAGTGSEVGRASVINHVQAEKKKIIFHPSMLPACVVADPTLTVGLSAKITAATGMDALSHNLEAYCSPGFHPMADGIALQAMGMIRHSLPKVVKDGTDLGARSEMLAASLMGATAFQKGLGAMHALAHPLGAVYDAHHGLLNAILMPYVLKYNEREICDKMCKLANVLELKEKSFSCVLDWILEIREEIGIPNSLNEIGISDDRVDEISAMAEADPSSQGNPRAMTKEDYEIILSNAIVGVF